MGRPFAAQDAFFREAKRLKYVARSAFKLLEIQRRYGVISRGANVLDLGCAPGAWLQVVCQHLGPASAGGCVVGVDLQAVPIPSSHCDAARVRTVRMDALSEGCSEEQLLSLIPASAAAVVAAAGRGSKSNAKQQLHPPTDLPREARHLRHRRPSTGFSVVLSDMCPQTSGADLTDVAGSLALAWRAVELAVGREQVENPSVSAQQPTHVMREPGRGDGGGAALCSDPTSLIDGEEEMPCGDDERKSCDGGRRALDCLSGRHMRRMSVMDLTSESAWDQRSNGAANLFPQQQSAFLLQRQSGTGPLLQSGSSSITLLPQPSAALATSPTQQHHCGVLMPGGHLVVKVLEGEGLQELFQHCKEHFKSVTRIRPRATRSSSREMYLVARGLHAWYL